MVLAESFVLFCIGAFIVNYDFSQLNDKEFEMLAVDLLSIYYERRIERFKQGKDGGVDGRFFCDDAKEVILQCKHYVKTGYSGLLSKLKSEEALKVKRLNPEKYVFVTSLPLSRDNKKEIFNIFSPCIKREDDIFGQEDLNDLLSKNPNVEENFFKLWISSVNVLQRLINNAIKGRSEFIIEEVKAKASRYIYTGNHRKGLEILKNKHVLIISGEPGIGKTTLAENLILYFVMDDYEFFCIEDSISEAEAVFIRGKKQIFYFDDFLGSNYFEAISDKKDSHVMNFIARVVADKSKFFVLTSRTNILNAGALYSPVLHNKNIRKNEYLIKIDDLTEFERAQILYNHIWFSSLPDEFIEQIYINKRYKNIVQHKSFNPRLIEFITDVDRIGLADSNDYWPYIENRLNNPSDIWGTCFSFQINDYARSLVALVVFNGGRIEEDCLKYCFHELNRLGASPSGSHIDNDFDSIAKLAVKSFLNRNFVKDRMVYSLFNPSISDYVLKKYCDNHDKLLSVFCALNTQESLVKLNSLTTSGFISQDEIKKLREALFSYAIMNEKSYDYGIMLAYHLDECSTQWQDILFFIKKLINDDKSLRNIYHLMSIIVNNIEDFDIKRYDFLIKSIHDFSLDSSDLQICAEFIFNLGHNHNELLEVFKGGVEQYLFDVLSEAENDFEMRQVVDFKDNGRYSIDKWRINDTFSAIVSDSLDDIFPDLVNRLGIDVGYFIDSINVDRMLDNYFESLSESDNISSHSGSMYSNPDQNIDDLFERS